MKKTTNAKKSINKNLTTGAKFHREIGKIVEAQSKTLQKLSSQMDILQKNWKSAVFGPA